MIPPPKRKPFRNSPPPSSLEDNYFSKSESKLEGEKEEISPKKCFLQISIKLDSRVLVFYQWSSNWGIGGRDLQETKQVTEFWEMKSLAIICPGKWRYRILMVPCTSTYNSRPDCDLKLIIWHEFLRNSNEIKICQSCPFKLQVTIAWTIACMFWC